MTREEDKPFDDYAKICSNIGLGRDKRLGLTEVEIIIVFVFVATVTIRRRETSKG